MGTLPELVHVVFGLSTSQVSDVATPFTRTTSFWPLFASGAVIALAAFEACALRFESVYACGDGPHTMPLLSVKSVVAVVLHADVGCLSVSDARQLPVWTVASLLPQTRAALLPADPAGPLGPVGPMA